MENEQVAQIIDLVKRTGSLLPIVGSLIYVRNKPFTEELPEPFESFFNLAMVPKTINKCARQVGKTTSMACQQIALSACIPHFITLAVTPLQEMTRRYSSNYVKPMLKYSPIAKYFLDHDCTETVSQKTLTNRSEMHFSYCSGTADRVRGIPCDCVIYDEVQDIDFGIIHEVFQVTGRSHWRLGFYSGTPKTLDNTAHVLWESSSQAEWLIPCSCGYTNNPHVEADGLKMIGDTTLVCAKCIKPIYAQNGYWQHMRPEVTNEFIGRHLPQFILPFHYESVRNWKIIRDAKAGAISKFLFMNEILGEACDVGAKLITETDLRKAAVNGPMDIKNFDKELRKYSIRIIGIDWGGRGEDQLSFTKIAILGLNYDSRVHLIYGENLSNLADGGMEIKRVLELSDLYQCSYIAHDTGGTSGMKDVMFAQSGIPHSKIMPFSYVSAWAKETVTSHAFDARVGHPYYSLNKTKSLVTLIDCIKNGHLLLPEYDSCGLLLKDFLALIEEKSSSARGAEVYLIRRSPNLCDDFVHAVNFACMAMFYTQERWPKLLYSDRYKEEEEKDEDITYI